jgi:hypothetical protein
VLNLVEVRTRPGEDAARNGGLPEALDYLAQRTGATDGVFTPAIAQDPKVGVFERYGTATLTYDGYTIDHAINEQLPSHIPGMELRSVGISSIHPPDGVEVKPFTNEVTHLANRPAEDLVFDTSQSVRDASLGMIGQRSFEIMDGRTFGYDAAISGTHAVSPTFPRRIVFSGDVNQGPEPTTAVLGRAGLRNVIDRLAEQGADGRARAATANRETSLWRVADEDLHIDQGHVSDNVAVRGVRVLDVPRNGLPFDVTDHRALEMVLTTP